MPTDMTGINGFRLLDSSATPSLPIRVSAVSGARLISIGLAGSADGAGGWVGGLSGFSASDAAAGCVDSSTLAGLTISQTTG
jgi:hypothetical protein